MQLELEKITQAVCKLTQEVGAYIQAEAKAFTSSKVEIKSFNQLVSYVDKTAEKILVEGLMKIYPDAGFLTEEETINNEQKAYTWVIDPLDGTTNFIHQIPVYSISVALLHNTKPIVGVVFEMNKNETFYAWMNGGTYLNGTKIHVKQTSDLSETLVATGFPYYTFEKVQSYLQVLQELIQKTRGVRRLGSAAVDLAYVACGRFDGFFESSLSPWDVAAGILLVEEAGGKVSAFDNNKNPIFDKEVIAASTAIYPSFAAIVQSKLA